MEKIVCSRPFKNKRKKNKIKNQKIRTKKFSSFLSFSLSRKKKLFMVFFIYNLLLVVDSEGIELNRIGTTSFDFYDY